ncbi:hypothetical protein BaRGS_00018160, partial [Batillaria attramentaria]
PARRAFLMRFVGAASTSPPTGSRSSLWNPPAQSGLTDDPVVNVLKFLESGDTMTRRAVEVLVSPELLYTQGLESSSYST